MRVVSLSRMLPFSPTLPELHHTEDQQDVLLEWKKASLPRFIILITKCLIPPLLVFALILTLISLLLPTVKHHETTFFSIQPIGHARKVTAGSLPVNSTSSSLSPLRASAVAAIRDIKQELEETSPGNDIVNATKTIVQSGNVRLEEWLGINGPSIRF